jgi:23S rRNA (cytidine1920-2'-O)/16S rRNA (cytidine1409-2'-O)-methyltransferase
MKRLDQRLVDEGLAPTRSKAQQMIEAGEVSVQGKVITQSSFKTSEPIQIQSDSAILKYVSRGGLKTEAALAHLQLDVAGWRCLDVGLSTGGFSDCLLQKGAAAIAGFDVGHLQLHPRLSADPRLKSWEGVHVRDLPQHAELQSWIAAGLDLTVVDVSFIGLENVLPFLPTKGRLLVLVKPQFEVGQEHLNRKGVVSDKALFDSVKSRVLHALEKYGFSISDYFPCAVKGQDGNQEFFAFAHRSP